MAKAGPAPSTSTPSASPAGGVPTYLDALPGFTANPGNATLSSDANSGANSIRIAPTAWASSPEKSGLTSIISHLPYLHWHWKKVGGTTVALAISLQDIRDTTKTGTIVYYAGAKPTVPVTLGPDDCSTVAPIYCVIQISDTIPSDWTTITRNLLEDGRQVFGFYNDVDLSGGTNVPNGGPTPDNVRITAYRLVAQNGAYALFDDMVGNSIPTGGDGSTAVSGPDFLVTRAGGDVHTFNREGLLTSISDADGNAVRLDWTYPAAGGNPDLTTIRAPGDGLLLDNGAPAVRRVAVTRPTSTSVRFTEQLSGQTGRYVEFARSATNDLVSVVPARRSSNCATSGPTGCTTYTYDASHRLTRIDDPRNPPSGTTYFTGVTYNASSEPTAINRGASAPQLTVLSWNSAANTFVRPKWQDADGIGSSVVQFADLSPNGSLLTEYVPQPCPAGNCSAVVPGDKLAVYTTDGIDNYSTETRFRLAGNQGPVVTRRGTYAAAQVDNYSDPVTAGLTAWTQSATQYAASVAAGNDDLYRTNMWYDADGRPVRTATPFLNPTDPANPAVQTVITQYDATGHPRQVSDAGFLANPGFEDALSGWTTAGTSATPDSGNCATGLGCLHVSGSGSAQQEAQLLPGQTFRFQAWVASTSGAAVVRIESRSATGAWDTANPIMSQSTPGASTISKDVSIPVDASGRIRVILTSSGNSFVDDVVILTTFAASDHVGGLLQTKTDILNKVTKFHYAGTSRHPAIFQTSVTENYVSGGAQTADQNVVSNRTVDAWGRELVATDPDGISTTTTYNATNKTDVASTADGLGNTTNFLLYDEIGQLKTEQNPLGRSKTTTYDWYGHEVDETDFDGTVAHSVFDAVGRQTEQYENWVNGGVGTSGVDNVKTTSTYDGFGRVTREVEDAGVSAATTDTTFDLLGNEVTETVYPDGTSNPRTTTTYFGAAGLAVGSAGPIVPTNAGSPTCPGAAGKCNTVTSVDMNGRAANVTDAYGKVSLTWYDFAGKPVREVDNYVAGGASNATQNVTTVTRYDAADRVVSVTDALGKVTSTIYDALGRVVKVTRPDTTWVSTIYRKSGRVDMESKPTATAGTEVWTKSVYDAAGRKTKTIDHYDASGTARLWLSSFEGGTDGWTGAGTGWFTASGATITSVSTDAATGSRSLAVATGSGGYAGASLGLSGSTFKQGHTYRIRARVKAPAGSILESYFGVDAPGGDYASFGQLPATGGWQALDGTWTPIADVAADIGFAIRRDDTSSFTFLVDDVLLWDASSAAINPSGPDWNIPSETAYDAAGRTIASVLPPGDPAVDSPMVTVTTYDYVGQVAGVRVNATPTYPVSVASEPAPVGHWRLDELTGTTAADAINGRTMSISGGVTLDAPSAIDDRPSAAMTFDGTTGKAQVPFDAAAWGLTGDKLTMEAWFKTNRTTGKSIIVRQSHYGLGFWLAQNGGVMEAVIYGSAQGWLTVGGYQDDAWHHMVATADGTTMRLYMDAQLKASTALSGNLNLWNDNLAIGAVDSNSEWFSGSIDEVALYASALSPAQISTHYDIGRSSDLNLLTTYAYDGVGNRVAARDPGKILSQVAYDRRGNVTSTTLNFVSGGSMSATQNVAARFAYNDRDEMTASCAPKQVQTGCDPSAPSTSAWRYAFDALGHIVTETPPANTAGLPLTATSYVYDIDRGGQRLLQTCDHPAGGSCATATRYIATAYDPLARVSSVIHYSGAPGSGTERLRTDSTFDAAGQQTGITYFQSAVQWDALTFAYDDLGRQTTVSRGATSITTATFNPDGSVKTRIDHAVGATASQFGYDWRGQQISATSPIYSGSTGFTWRLDGLLGSRTWPTGGNAATYGYDRAKRPVSMSETRSGAAQAAFTRSYNRAGDTISEGRTLSAPITGIAGSGTQSFTYDALHRVTSASISGGPSQTYGYDANSNRTSWNDGIATTTYAFNESDELLSQLRSGVTRTFSYDTYGNMTSSAVASAGATTYAYDAQDRLTSIAPPSGGAITFELDALGRHATKRIGGALVDTYGYAGASEAVVRIDQPAGSVSSAVDGLGNRVATATGAGGFGWLLADLHGDVAAGLNVGGTTLTDAFRYDPYGMTIDKNTSSLPTPWRFQGRLLLNKADGTGANTDLYDFVARAYDPNLGAFTSLDTVRGTAQNPITLNRFLYALANPESMIDPDGHWPWDDVAKAVENVGNFAIGVGEGLVSAGAAAVTGTIELGKAAVGAAVNAGGCAISSSCRNRAIAAAGNAVRSFARDPGGSIRRVVDGAGSALGAAAKGFEGAVRGAVDKVSTAWRTGNFRELGRMTGEVGFNFIPVGGIVGRLGMVGRLTTAGSRITTTAGRATAGLGRAATSAQRFMGAARGRLNATIRRGASCMNSFSAATVVATAAGAVAIASLAIGDQVLAYDETTGRTEPHAVTAVHINNDPITGRVIIDGEVIETTPEHPFYTLEAGWLDAEYLRPDMHVPSADGDPGVIETVQFSDAPARMYNLTVEDAHTFYVGVGQWLVHNDSCPIRGARWDENVQRYRDSAGRFASGPSRSNKIVIGENMAGRVRPAARKLGASVYRPTRFSAASREALRASVRRDYEWTVRKIKQGAKIYDKGRDPNRAKRSIFYYVEQRAIRRYRYPTTPI